MKKNTLKSCSEIHIFFFIAAQTEQFMFQNVAYRTTVCKTGKLLIIEFQDYNFHRRFDLLWSMPGVNISMQLQTCAIIQVMVLAVPIIILHRYFNVLDFFYYKFEKRSLENLLCYYTFIKFLAPKFQSMNFSNWTCKLFPESLILTDNFCLNIHICMAKIY